MCCALSEAENRLAMVLGLAVAGLRQERGMVRWHGGWREVMVDGYWRGGMLADEVVQGKEKKIR